MSKVSTVYDAMITRITALLPNHARLGNPYAPASNASLFLKQGYGVKIGPARDTNRIISNQKIIAREYTVVVTRKFLALENAPETKATTEKQLLEDAYLLVKDFETNTTINETAVMTSYTSDGGIEFIDKEKDHFLIVETVFTVEYLENLT